MYGYVRPVKGELKVSEFERFQAVYCALCHALARRHGFLCRFLVNYDFTFLAMLLAEEKEPPAVCRRRCPAHPLRRTPCLGDCSGLERAADMTVILGWWKLADGAEDKGFPASWGCKAACLVLKRAYRRAAASEPGFAAAVEERLRQLQLLERSECDSVDATADKFALILRAIADGESAQTRRRVLGELLYHLGRIIYILDAADDLERDTRSGDYNPLSRRFVLRDGKLSPEDERTLRLSLQHSHNAISAAFGLIEPNAYHGILSNTVYLGLPAAAQAVFAGTWRASAKIQRERSRL